MKREKEIENGTERDGELQQPCKSTYVCRTLNQATEQAWIKKADSPAVLLLLPFIPRYNLSSVLLLLFFFARTAGTTCFTGSAGKIVPMQGTGCATCSTVLLPSSSTPFSLSLSFFVCSISMSSSYSSFSRVGVVDVIIRRFAIPRRPPCRDERETDFYDGSLENWWSSATREWSQLPSRFDVFFPRFRSNRSGRNYGFLYLFPLSFPPSNFPFSLKLALFIAG